jgi:hypothetical protein
LILYKIFVIINIEKRDKLSLFSRPPNLFHLLKIYGRKTFGGEEIITSDMEHFYETVRM